MKSAFAFLFGMVALGWMLPVRVYGGGLAVAVEPVVPSTVVGEPVVLRCEFSNDAETPVTLDLGFNDATNLSFVLHPGGERPVVLSEIQRGGGGDFGSGKPVIAPHEHTVRYLVLNQWFRPSATGEYPLEMVVKAGERPVTARFQVTIVDGGAEFVRPRAEAMIQRYLEWQVERDDPLRPEWFSYRHALLMAFTYIQEGFPEIVREAKERHTGQRWVMEMLEEARVIGPGGSRALD